MIEYVSKKQADIARVICNKCGRELLVENGIVKGDFCEVNKLWGYFSKKDGQRDRFDLCEECYDLFVAGFVIPATNIEEKELI